MNRIRKKFNTILCISLVLTSAAFTQGYEAGQSEPEQTRIHWPDGKEMAISLSFDDARLSQVDKGIPILDAYGVKATFYVSPDLMLQRLEGWKEAVANGHDIGNHSLRHPCTGNFSWSRHKALEEYTLDQMSLELDSANRFLQEVLGVTPVSFAYPCGQTFVGRGLQTRSYVPLVFSMFETGRTWMDEIPNDPGYCDFGQITGVELDGKSFKDILRLIEEGKSRGSWLVLAGHEMDVGGSQTSLLSTIDSLCQYASDPANGIWIDHVANLGRYLRGERDSVKVLSLFPVSRAAHFPDVTYLPGRFHPFSRTILPLATPSFSFRW